MKKQSFLKLFAGLLAIVMLITTLVACGVTAPLARGGEDLDAPVANSDNLANQTAAQDGVAYDESEYLVLGERGLTTFSVVFGAKAYNLTKSETVLFQEYIEEVSGATVPLVEDGSRISQHEVFVGIVGKMGRDDMETFAAQYELGLDDYVIKVENGSLIVACGSKEASAMALAFLKKRLLYVDEVNETIAVRKDLHYVMRYGYQIDDDGIGLTRVELNSMRENELLFTINPGSEHDVPVRITNIGEGGWRIQTKYNMATDFVELGAAQLLATTLGETVTDDAQPLLYWNDGKTVIAKAPDGTYVILDLTSFSLKFCDADGNLTRTVTELNHSFVGDSDILDLHVNFSLNDTEAIFGTGERFDSVNQRGKQVVIQGGNISDAVDNSYVAIPLFSSSRGSGIFMNNNGYMVADIGATNHNELGIELSSGHLDCYVYVTDQVTDVINHYSKVTGYASMPEEWVSGMLVCRYDAQLDTYEAVTELIAKIEAYGITWTGLLIDDWDISDFNKHDELKQVCDYVHSLGKKVICNVAVGYLPDTDSLPEEFAIDEDDLDGFMLGWTFSYYYTSYSYGAWENSPLTSTTTQNIPLLADANDMLNPPVFIAAPAVTKDPATCNPFMTKVETNDRNESSDDVLYETRTYIDITNPVAVEWFFGTYWDYLVNEVGLDGAKIDGGNTLPDTLGTLHFYDETTPSGGARAWYSTTFASLLNETLSKKPDSGICFTRGGGIGSQRNSYILGGEQSRTINRLERQVKGLLSAGLSGLPFVSYDIGGSFYKNDDVLDIDKEADIFLRAAQFSIFTGTMQTVDGEVRGAFDFAEEDPDFAYVTELYKLYSRMHTALTPYIEEYSKVACETGMPLARHLVLAYQNDTNVYNIDDEYLFGDAFLVAPELYCKDSREVYLPEGKWKNLLTNEEYTVGPEGMTITCENISMAEIPVFYNMNTTSQTASAVLAEMTDLLAAIRAIQLP